MTLTAQLSVGLPSVEACRQLLLIQLEEFQKNARLVFDQDRQISVDAIHDLRVAIRRILTVQQNFAPWLDPDWLCQAQKYYGSLQKPLGKIRDLDVFCTWIKAEHPDQAAIISQLDGVRQKYLGKLIDRQKGKSFQKWLDRQVAGLALPDAAIQMTAQAISPGGRVNLFRLSDCLPVILYQTASQLTVFHSIIQDTQDMPPAIKQEMAGLPEDIVHHLRLAAKTFRYTLEAYQSLLGPEASRLIQEFKAFQDLLGNWHDAVVAMKYLQQLQGDDQKTAQLAALQAERQQRTEQLQNEFLNCWAAMSPNWFHERLSTCLDYGLKNS